MCYEAHVTYCSHPTNYTCAALLIMYMQLFLCDSMFEHILGYIWIVGCSTFIGEDVENRECTLIKCIMGSELGDHRAEGCLHLTWRRAAQIESSNVGGYDFNRKF